MNKKFILSMQIIFIIITISFVVAKIMSSKIGEIDSKLYCNTILELKDKKDIEKCLYIEKDSKKEFERIKSKLSVQALRICKKAINKYDRSYKVLMICIKEVNKKKL